MYKYIHIHIYTCILMHKPHIPIPPPPNPPSSPPPLSLFLSRSASWNSPNSRAGWRQKFSKVSLVPNSIHSLYKNGTACWNWSAITSISNLNRSSRSLLPRFFDKRLMSLRFEIEMNWDDMTWHELRWIEMNWDDMTWHSKCNRL